ncbi:unnamed protein product [Alopecurus aequalis]
MENSRVRVVSKSIVKASVARPRVVLAVSNLDLLYHSMPLSMICVYRKPLSGGGFLDMVAAFEAKLPALLDNFFPLAGRIVANPRSRLPEVHCDNQGAELVVGEADAALASLDYGDLDASLARIGVPVQYGAAVALSVQLVSFACGGFVVEIAAAPNHDRSAFRPRASPSYTGLGDVFTLLESDRLVNSLTAASALVVRTYYVEEQDLAPLRAQASTGEERAAVSAYLWKVFATVVGSSDERCRMGWWVNGRPRLAANKEMRDYVGNVTTFAVTEASVDAIQGRSLTVLNLFRYSSSRVAPARRPGGTLVAGRPSSRPPPSPPPEGAPGQSPAGAGGGGDSSPPRAVVPGAGRRLRAGALRCAGRSGAAASLRGDGAGSMAARWAAWWRCASVHEALVAPAAVHGGRRGLRRARELCDCRDRAVVRTAVVVLLAQLGWSAGWSLTGLASMVRESIKATAIQEHFQELVDWVEENKGNGKGKVAAKFVETATIGLVSRLLGLTSFASFSLSTDFGFGHAAMAMPAWMDCGRLCCGFVKIIARPWEVTAAPTAPRSSSCPFGPGWPPCLSPMTSISSSPSPQSISASISRAGSEV